MDKVVVAAKEERDKLKAQIAALDSFLKEYQPDDNDEAPNGNNRASSYSGKGYPTPEAAGVRRTHDWSPKSMHTLHVANYLYNKPAGTVIEVKHLVETAKQAKLKGTRRRKLEQIIKSALRGMKGAKMVDFHNINGTVKLLPEGARKLKVWKKKETPNES